MGMVTPIEKKPEALDGQVGRPLGDRTLEIMAEIQLAEALGRVTAVMEIDEWEQGRFGRFASKARTAAAQLGRKVRVRRLGDDRAEITILGE